MEVTGEWSAATKEPDIMSQQQMPDVEPMEDPGGGRGMPAHSIIAAVMELQSLVEWTAQRKGIKEDPTIVNEKLRQLDRIRKDLEKSAKLQAQLFPSYEEASPVRESTDDTVDTELDFPSSDIEMKSTEDSSDHIIVPFICDQENSYRQPLQDPTKDIHDFSVCAMEDSFQLDDIPPPIDEHSCDSALEESTADLYIDFVSAKEEIEKLTMDLDIEEEAKTSDKVGTRHHTTEEPDSLGTAISEDEGLGEESRRADSTGSNSFLDIHTSEEDLVDSGAGTSSVLFAKDDEPAGKDDVVWINDPQDPRLSIELCRCTIYKLKECLKAKEEQLKRFSEECKDNKQVKLLQTSVNNLKNEIEELKNEIEDLKSRLRASEKENSELHEQVLELEEAENDSRRQYQRYEEKVLFLQEKDAHFQAEFLETKQALEMCMSTLAMRDTKEKELRSQLKYMEVLVQKYEDQIKTLEASEAKLKQKIGQLEEQLSKSQKPEVQHKGTQVYPQKEKKVTEGRGSSKTSDSCPCEKHCSAHRDKIRSRLKGSADRHSSHRDEASSRNSSIKSLADLDMCDTAQISEIGIQVDSSEFLTESGTQTEYDVPLCCESSCSTTGEIQTFSPNSSITSAIELSGESTSIADLENTVSSSCPFQQELFRRLHHLVEEDAHLQQQLHHMDQINLTLWQKLHNLEFHIGECKKENFQHSERMDDESHTRDTASPENIPPRECSPQHSLDPLEEEHYISSGKLINLDFNEEELKDRLLRLEKINSTFEAELRNREKLYQRKEQKHKEWMEAEDRFTCDIRYLQMEKSSLLAKVTQLEAEKQSLTNKLLVMVDDLSCLQERHRKQILLLTEEHEALVSELRSRIELLTKKEKEYVGQISTLRVEKKRKEIPPGEKSELENLKASYVQLQIELSQNRSNMEKMENEFEERLEELKQSHLIEEARLEKELKSLREKEADYDEQFNTYQKRQSELEAALSDKEQQLEDARLEFREQLLAMEEEHKAVEIELNKKLRQMEESTAVATKALTEEKTRLEKELQENLYDLRTKEEQYKSRIAELESNVSQLHVELRRLTGDLDAGFPESDGAEFPAFQKERLQKQLQELQRREGDLREKLDEMEQKEAAYRETLENADRIVASVERGYKNKIEELEMSERSLKQRVIHLEEIESKLRVALHRERRSSDGRKPDDLVLELLEAEVRENTLKERIETLEQSQRSTIHRLKELEKIRESLEAKMADYEEIMASLDRLQQEHDNTRKEIAKLRISESGLRLALQQAEGMLKNRETDMRNEMARMQEEKKDLEETIHQLRIQVRQLQLLMDSNQEEEADGETLSESVHRSEIPEGAATPTEGETLEPSEEKTCLLSEEGPEVSDETTMKTEKAKNITFEEKTETLTNGLDESSSGPEKFPENSEQDKDRIGDAPLESSDMMTFSDSLDVPEESGDRLPPTVEFFLPEPKKLQYEVVEASIPESQHVQEKTTPLTPTETPESVAAQADSLPKTRENIQSSEMIGTSTPIEEAEKVEKVTLESSDKQPAELHSDTTVTNSATDAVQTSDSSVEPARDSKGLPSSSSEGSKSDADKTETEDEDAAVPSDESSKTTCDIQLLNEELAGELSSEGSTTVPADSILRLLRGLRPASGSSGPSTSTGARAKVRSLLKRHVSPVDPDTVSISQDGDKKDDLCADDEDQVDWLKVAEESASRYEEEKKSLEDEVKRLREKATAIEKEKEALQESLNKDKEVEHLRDINSKLQEEVSLLQKRLTMAAHTYSIEPKKEETKRLPDESSPKEEEVKKESKTDQTAKKTTESSGIARATGVPRSPTSPPPPIDDCQKERMQLEENMIRAMVAMQFDMKQKKAAKRFSPVFGGDTSTRPKVPVSQGDEVVAMGACSSEVGENRSSSSSSTVQSPYNFRVVQQVGSDTVLVGWEHANPTELEGFEVYVNGTLHETVYTPDRTKAVISGLDMQQPLTLSVCAISRFGDVSEPQLLQLQQRDNISKDGFFFLDDDDDDDFDDLFYVDEEIEKQTRPYSMEW